MPLSTQSRRTGKSVGLSLALGLSELPRTGRGALSISSGYETYLTLIRQRIVCEEDDVYDAAERQGWAQTCNSMMDGPFCRGLPVSASSRHKPFTVDSIVPQSLFGDARFQSEVGQADPGSTSEEAQDSGSSKQATAILNHFLEEFYSPREALTKPLALEGRLDFSRVPLRRGGLLPPTFSRGLPGGVLATWDGAWQVLPCPALPAPSRRRPASLAERRHAARVPAAAVVEKPQRFTTAASFSGALASLRFSRPVVIRRLVLRPPMNAAAGWHRLIVRARKAGQEMWRSAYDFDASLSAPQTPPACGVGDLVLAHWAGDGRQALGVLLALHNASATVRWLDNDHSHRLVPWSHLKTAGGVPCPLHPWAPLRLDPKFSKARDRPEQPTVWRDLARRLKAVDEVSFLIPYGADGWVIGEVAVAATRWLPHDPSLTEDADDEAAKHMSAHMVQVFPGPRAVIVEASKAAVLYHADDMLERGLRLKSARAWSRPVEDASSVPPDASGEEAEVDLTMDTSSRLRLSSSRCSEGVQQLLRALADPRGALRLPAHMRPEQLFADLDRFISALDPSKAEERVVKRYSHFEEFFAFHWDWLTPVDALEMAFEHWRRDPVAQREAQGVFFSGQEWAGAYFCTQGPTALSLAVTNVTLGADGRETIRADLTFVIDSKQKRVRGQYEVAGKIDPLGRALWLEPVPDSWKDKPKNFVMVPLQGIVSLASSGASELRFAGSVPIYGCDAFELKSRLQESPAPAPAPDSAPSADVENTPVRPSLAAWNDALTRFGQALERIRQKWRLELTRLIGEKGPGKRNATAATSSQIAHLVEAVRNAGGGMAIEMVEVTNEAGEEFVVKIGR